MSDTELRKILLDVIEDLDTGRVTVGRRKRRFVQWVGGPVLAASLGLAAGCTGRSVGYTGDAGPGVDVQVQQQLDAGTAEDYAAPPVDAGAVWAYGVPPTEFDAAVEESDAEVDGGVMDLYGVPFDEDAAIDPPPEAMYAAPDHELEPAPDGGTDPDDAPNP